MKIISLVQYPQKAILHTSTVVHFSEIGTYIALSGEIAGGGKKGKGNNNCTGLKTVVAIYIAMFVTLSLTVKIYCSIKWRPVFIFQLSSRSQDSEEARDT